MCFIFLRPHPKLGPTTFMNRVPLTPVPSRGDLPLPSLSPHLSGVPGGCPHVGTWAPLSTTTPLARFPFLPPPAPSAIVWDEPSDSPQVPPPSHSNSAPNWLRLMAIEVMLFGVLQHKAPHCAEAHLKCKVPVLLMLTGTLEGGLIKGARLPLLSLSCTMVNSMGCRGWVTRTKLSFHLLCDIGQVSQHLRVAINFL